MLTETALIGKFGSGSLTLLTRLDRDRYRVINGLWVFTISADSCAIATDSGNNIGPVEILEVPISEAEEMFPNYLSDTYTKGWSPDADS